MDATIHPLLYDLHDPGVIADPYPVYARMRRDAPVWHNPASGSWAVTRYADVRHVLDAPEFSNARTAELFARLPAADRSLAEPLRPLLEPRLLFTEEERHRRLRALLMQGFTPAHLQNYSGLITDRLNALLRDLPRDEPVDLLQRVCGLLPGMVILSLLGIPLREQDDMRTWTDAIYAWMGHFPGSIVERTHRALEAVDGLRGRLRGHMEAVRITPRPDLLSALVHAREEGEFLDENELIANVIGLVNAGQETTGCLLANGLLRLLQFPEQMERLRQAPEAMATAVEEMLRYDAPAQFVARRVNVPVDLGGVRLEPGTLVAVGLGSANRDESVFRDPDRFDISRHPNPHLSFGHGRHFCLGNALARLEATTFFTALLQRFPRIEPAWEGASPAWRPTLSFRCPNSLPVVLRSRTGAVTS
ncbi:MAG: cytochrome P450 [Verrucomicrobiae bacterium]|nr:cytochrome P450 [Verrucomicrobiae bacterium]